MTGLLGVPVLDSSPLFVADFDGDGTDDVVYGSGVGPHWIVRWGQRYRDDVSTRRSDEVSVLGDVTLTQPVDIDGDGKSEIVSMVIHGTQTDIDQADTYQKAQAIFRYEVWRWNESVRDFQKVPNVLPGNPATLSPDAFLDPSCKHGDLFHACEHLFFADVNGDALPDIVKAWDDRVDNVYRPTKFELYLNTGGAFAAPISLPLSLAPGEDIAYHTWFFATTHDGRQYVRYLRGPSVRIGSPFHYASWVVGLRSDMTPETFASGPNPPWDGTRPKPLEMDADGDGVRELTWLPDSHPWYPNERIPVRADIDGDGREDVVVHNKSANTVEVYMSKTLADSAAPVFALTYTLSHPSRFHTWVKVTTGDFDGDGRVDIGAIDNEGSFYSWTHLRADEIFSEDGIPDDFDVDLLTEVRDADHAGPRETVLYQRVAPVLFAGEPLPGLWEVGSPPAPGCSPSSYPTVCIRRGVLPVVAKHKRLEPRPDDPEAMLTTDYGYFYPSADLHGRGFLGFKMIRTWEYEQAVETETTFRHDERVGTRYPYAFLPARVQTATLLDDVSPQGRWRGGAAPRSGPGRVKLVEDSPTVRPLNGGATYLVVNERTDTFEWEEDVEIANWWHDTGWPSDHVWKIDASPKSAPRRRTIDPSYDDYGNVIAQVATTAGGVISDFTLDPEPPNTTAWLVDLPKDYKYRSWTPALHAAPAYRHIHFEHDASGRLTAQSVEPTSTDVDVQQTITYVRDPAHGSYGQVTAVVRQAPGVDGGRRVDGVDWHDRTGEQIFPALAWNGLSHTKTFIYHPAYGVLLAEASADGVETIYDWDDLGRPRGTNPAGGDAVELSYREVLTGPSALEKLEVKASSASGDVRTTVLDALGRPVRRTVLGMDGLSKEMSLSYDVLGRPWETSNWGAGAPATEKTVQRYDTLGRPRFVDRPDSTSVETRYVGLFESIHLDAKRARKRQIRDLDDRLIETYATVEGTEVLSSSIAYKPFDLPGILRDADRNATEFFYDALGRKAREEDPTTGTTRFYHNGLGELRREEHGPGAADAVVYHRDDLGRVRTMETRDGTVTFDWDATNGTGKLKKETNFDGTVVQHRYDDFSRLSGSTWVATGSAESFDIDVKRDGYGRVVQTLYPDTGGGERLAIEQVFEGAYVKSIVDATDPAKQKVLWTITERAADGALRKGTFGASLADYQADYDAMGQPTRIQTQRGSGDLLMDIEIKPDENGNVHRRQDHVADRIETFGYDELYRLRYWTNTSGGVTVARELRYDAIGNLEKVLSGSTVLEEFVDRGAAGPQKLDHATGGVTYDYDHRGRQTRAGSRTVTYNAFDLPRSVQEGLNGSVYEYTAAGERFRQTDTLGILETIYIDRLYERHKVGTTQATHVHHVMGPDGPVADIIVDAAGRRVSYLVVDAIGSTTVRFDETLAPGAAPERIHYEPFGRRINADGSAWTGTWGASRNGFAGVEHDELGLVNMGGRIYDPGQRRFLTPDPLVSDPYFDQAWHRYSYARNNPATLTDPTGYWVPPAWLCGQVGPLGFSFGSFDVGGGAPSMPLVRTQVPDVTPDGYHGPAAQSTPGMFGGTGYAGGDGVARWLIDNGVDAWLQRNGDQAIYVALGTSYVALSIATFGAAESAGVFVGAEARIASFGARSWRTITGVAGAIGEGVRRYGNQATRWGAQLGRGGEEIAEEEVDALSAARGEARAAIDPAKFNYLFGQATGRGHNIARTAQNAQQLGRIVIHNTVQGWEILQSHLNQAVQDQGNVIRTFTNQYGTFEVRESLLAGPGGFLKIESTWQIMTDGARRFSTLIPMGG